MSNPSGPDHETQPVGQGADPETEILATPDADTTAAPAAEVEEERRFTAPSAMDAGATEIIDRHPDPQTEIIRPVDDQAITDPGDDQAPKAATPQSIPARPGAAKSGARRSWGWVLALILVIAALVAVAILGTVLLTRTALPRVSPEERVRETIQSYDTAIEKGDLATLRSITCGATAEEYNNLDDRKWTETHRRVADAGQYPVIASIDQVVIHGDHAEANVTAFVASDPATRSTRSLDLQFRDDQWKICQTTAGG